MISVVTGLTVIAVCVSVLFEVSLVMRKVSLIDVVCGGR